MKGLTEVAEWILERDDFVIVPHYDADGISAAAIMALTLHRLGKSFKFKTSKALDPQRIKEIRDTGDNFIFVDLGSGALSQLEEILKDKQYCIIDHHKPEKKYGDGVKQHFNPSYSDHDGADEISGAGATYLVSKELNANNKDLSKIAIIGAIGDMQDSRGALEGLNREILKDAVDAGEIEVRKDIRLFGRHSRPLIQFLSYCTDPFLPGLTANEESARFFIMNLGIELVNEKQEWKTYVDLTEDEKKRFISALYVYGKQHNTPEFLLRSLIGEVYELKKEENKTEVKDAKEFSTLLNACGRHEQELIGIHICMGDREDEYKKAKTLLQNHRRMLHDGIKWAQTTGVRTMKNIYVLDCGTQIKETLVGVIAGMLYGAQVINHDKPIIALSDDADGKIKVSGRATWTLVNMGLDLGKVLKKTAGELGGVGGGHSIAAGARVEPDKKEEFLKLLDDAIGKQLSDVQ